MHLRSSNTPPSHIVILSLSIIEANASLSRKFDPSSKQFISVEWRTLAVGDIIQIASRETVPADVLVLGVAECPRVSPRGICYVETKSLDGETNLKLRSALSTTDAQVYHLFVLAVNILM